MKQYWCLKNLLYALAICMFIQPLHAQPSKLDSLLAVAESAIEKERVDALISIVEERNRSRIEFEKAIDEIGEALYLAESINYQTGVAEVYAVLGAHLMKSYRADSAVLAFKKAAAIFSSQKNLTRAYHLTISQGESLFVMGKYQQSDSLAQLVSRSEIFQSDALLFERTLLLLASNDWGKGNYNEAVEHYLKLIKALEASEKFMMLDKAYSGIATCYAAKNEFSTALNYQLASLEILEQLNADPRQFGLRFLNIGTLYGDMEDFEQAVKYAHLAEEKLEQVNFLNGLVYVYHLFGQSYQGLEEKEKAYSAYNKSLDLVLQVQPTNSYMLEGLYRNLASLSAALNQFKSGVELAKKGLHLALEMKNSHSIAKSHLALGINYKGLEKMNSAFDHFHKCEMIASEGKFNDVLLILYEEMAEAYAQIEEPNNTVDYFRKHLLVRDSLEKIERRDQVAELQTKYETSKKENEIAQLSQQAQIQDLELDKRNYLIMAVSIVSIVLMVAGILFHRHRKLQSTKEAADLEQKLLRSQMNPHFIFNALGSIRNALFEKSLDETEVYLTKFSKLMRQILEHSRTDFISLQEEIDMLTNYCDLQKFRFNQSFEYEIIVDDQLDPEETYIPPMLAQPFIENALEHGLEHDKKDGKIDIDFAIKYNELILTITDNGIGVEETQKLRTTHTGHQSLASIITKERLAHFNQKIKLSIHQLAGGDKKVSGTKVMFALPFREM